MGRQQHLREITKVATEYGYSYQGKTSRGHFKWRTSDGRAVITGSALSDARSFQNAVGQLRRYARQQESA